MKQKTNSKNKFKMGIWLRARTPIGLTGHSKKIGKFLFLLCDI